MARHAPPRRPRRPHRRGTPSVGDARAPTSPHRRTQDRRRRGQDPRRPVAGLFTTDIGQGQFRYDCNHDAFAYEELLAGRWVLTTSITRPQASPAKVLTAYRQLLAVEHRFRVLKHTLDLRPIYHWTETRVRGHVAVCKLAALIETLIEADLTNADVADPDLDGQVVSTERALRELERIRQVTLTAGDHHIDVVTRPKPLQAAICAACHIDTTPWQHSHIH